MNTSKTLWRTASLATLMALTGASAQAQTQTQNTAGGSRPFIGMGVSAGGDTLVTVRWSDGTTKNIKSGGGVDLRFGYDFRSPNSSTSWQISVGYFTDAANGSNGSVHFDRYPVELMGFWNISEQMRLGAGLRLATGAKLRSSGAASLGGAVDFKAKPGAVIEGEYLVGSNLAFSLRYVAEKYKLNNTSTTVDGNHVGFRMNYYF